MKTITNDKPMLPILKKTTNEGSYRMGCINGLSSKEMLNLLGASNSKGDPDKTKWEWEFFYEGVRCLVWDITRDLTKAKAGPITKKRKEPSKSFSLP